VEWWAVCGGHSKVEVKWKQRWEVVWKWNSEVEAMQRDTGVVEQEGQQGSISGGV